MMQQIALRSFLMDLPFFSIEQNRLAAIFHAYAYDKFQASARCSRRFVHYTTADTTVKILDSKEIWLRKTSCMNDFMELEHGISCLDYALGLHRNRFEKLFDGLFPNFSARIIDLLKAWLPHFKNDTFIICVSEHEEYEDLFGRLSMWRAYGLPTGVAIVLNSGPLLIPSDALKSYTSPVAYLDKVTFAERFDAFIRRAENEADFIKSCGEVCISDCVFESLRAAVMCTKHPGFFEEKEWRVIYSPSFERTERIKIEIHSINGVPQPIAKIKLVDIPAENLIGISPAHLIDRLIIGPTEHPYVIKEALIEKLKYAGVSDAEKKVFISSIPLRN